MNIQAIGNTTIGKAYHPTLASGTKAASGDNTVVAAPGATKRIVVKEIVIQNESAVATTAILKSGANSHWRALLDQYRSLSLGFNTGEEWRLGANEALILNLSGANSHGYSVRYTTEMV